MSGVRQLRTPFFRQFISLVDNINYLVFTNSFQFFKRRKVNFLSVSQRNHQIGRSCFIIGDFNAFFLYLLVGFA